MTSAESIDNRMVLCVTLTKNRLSESVIPRPFREFYLADHHRLDPVTPPHFSGGQSLVPTVPASRREVVKGTFFNANFVQLRVEGTEVCR